MGYVSRHKPTILEFGGDTYPDFFQITNAASTLTLPSISIPASIGESTKVYLDVRIGCLKNTAALANKFHDDVQSIQVKESVSGAWTSAITMNSRCTIPASTQMEVGRIYGNINIASQFKTNSTMSVRWLDSKADQNNIEIYFLQPIIRIVTGMI